MANIKTVKNVVISAYLTGTTQFNFNPQNYGFDLSGINPDICVIRTIQWYNTGTNQQALSAVWDPNTAGVTIWSNLGGTNNPIGTLSPSWYASGGNVVVNSITCNANSSPNTIISLGGVAPRTINFWMRKNALNNANQFQEIDTTLSGYLGIAIDFIEYKKGK